MHYFSAFAQYSSLGDVVIGGAINSRIEPVVAKGGAIIKIRQIALAFCPPIGKISIEAGLNSPVSANSYRQLARYVHNAGRAGMILL